MTRRTLASTIAVVLLLGLFALVALFPVPFVTMSPGPTINVLGTSDGKQIVQISGHKAYRDKGDLRLTTVSVTAPDRSITLPAAMWAWFDGTRAVYPRDVIYPPQQSAQQAEQESSVEMVSSQDTAVAAALTELGYKPTIQTEVLAVTPGSPADGKLKTRDRILAIDGKPVRDATAVSKAVEQAGAGTPVRFQVKRDGETKTVTVVPAKVPGSPGKARVGIVVGEGYQFPFNVQVKIPDRIGGPSAGLIFSLAIYDSLTPGSLTGGHDVAGTGTISRDGSVGPIGGIQQKIVAAADAGAKLFLVPPANCRAALNADVTKGEIRLVKAPTMHSAVTSLKKYAADPHAALPKCG